jgi:alcohol dehydrogenase (cytochrome c)
MTLKRLIPFLPLLAVPVLLSAQGKGLDPADILKPLSDSWVTYNGDYSGKRYSSLTQVNKQNVKHLTLAWFAKLTGGSVSTGGGGFGFGRGGFGGGNRAPLIVGGEGTGEYPVGTDVTIKASVLAVDGTLYVTSPDNAWAIDARDGRELWHYFWKTRGGTHIATRGFGMWKNYLYMETPDNYLVSLEAKTGKERWHKVIADFSQQYFSTMAPVVVGNHVICGTGNDLDAPGFLQSFDPETGELQWKLYTVPMNPGDPGLETWPSLDAARHGGAQPWLGGAYDPETHLYIFGTGNPTPAYTAGRGEGDNLFTGSLIAVNVDTGKMAWYFQTAPHDMHDWDSAQTPVLVDAPFKGRMRKLVMTAARNGYFFVLDRVTGEHLLTTKYGSTTNWVKEIDAKGRPMRNPEKDASIGGALVSPSAGGTINWQPPAFNPNTGLFYVGENNLYSIFYLLDTDPRGSMGLGGHRDRLPHGTGRVAAQVRGRHRRWRRRPDDRRRPRIRRRWGREHRGA